MKNIFSKIPLIIILLSILLAGCANATEQGPEEVYWEYHEACQSGQYETAQGYLTEEARKRSVTIGVCGFTHDALSDIDLANGITEHTFTGEPEINVEEDHAVMTWIDDMGVIISVFLSKTEEGWKVAEILRSI